MTRLDQENFEKTGRERVANAPRRLPRKRPRALTHPLPIASSGSHYKSWNPFRKSHLQQTIQQSQSPLFGRLPLEIRQLIWEQVLGGHLLHITRAPKRLLAIACPQNVETEAQARRHGCWGITSDINAGFYVRPRSGHPARPANFLPLLQTCRMAYSETISIIYADNTFDINHIDTLIYMKQSILPQRLEQIRTLNLKWDFKLPVEIASAPYNLTTWCEACDVLASFESLQELTVHLKGQSDLTPGDYYKDRWGPLLSALMPIKTAKRFNVLLPWSEDECINQGRRYPFRLLSEIPRLLTEEELLNDYTLEL